MVKPNRVGRLIKSLPVSKDDIIAYGVTLFLDRVDPEFVRMSWRENGFELVVKADDEKVQKLKEFWETKIGPRL